MLLVAFCNWLDSLKVKSYDVTIQVRSDLHRTILLFTIFCFQEIIHGGSLKFYTLWAVRYSVHFELAVELGGGTPYMMAYIERLHPKELRYERVGLLRVSFTSWGMWYNEKKTHCKCEKWAPFSIEGVRKEYLFCRNWCIKG